MRHCLFNRKFLNPFPLPASLFQVNITQQADGSGIYVFGEPAYSYVHFQEQNDEDDENQVAGQGNHLQQKSSPGIACTRYRLEENKSGTLEEVAGAEHPKRRDGGIYQVGHVGVDTEHIRRQTGYQQDDRPDNAGAEPYVLPDGRHDIACFSGSEQVADQSATGGGKSRNGHERYARHVAYDVGDGQ